MFVIGKRHTESFFCSTADLTHSVNKVLNEIGSVRRK